MGRKHSILIASSLLLLGISCELLGFNANTLLLGRFTGGLGTGLMTNTIPLYQSEIAPPDIRGRLISLFSLLGSFGQMVGYFVTFRTSYLDSDWCWRTPWLVQLIICFVFMLSIFFIIPYSPRWLIDKGRTSEGLQVLSQLHHLPPDHELVQRDYVDIKTFIEAEKNSNRTYSELFHPPNNLKRTMYAFFIAIATCFTGNAIISYYAPQIFKNAGLSDVSTSLALTGGIGFLSLVFTAVSLQWWIDLWGRKALFFVGSTISAICMIVVGFMFQFNTIEDGQVVVVNRYARYTIIFCIYLFSASFAGTWGVANYVYTAEIFSMRCRAKGLSLTYTLSWAIGIIIIYCTPFFLEYSISAVHYFFGLCSVLIIIGTSFIPETKGKTLEEIDFMFEDVK